MDGKLIDGIKRSENVREKLRHDVMLLKERGFKAPQLATILVGDDYASQIYIERKTSAAAAVGGCNILIVDRCNEFPFP